MHFYVLVTNIFVLIALKCQLGDIFVALVIKAFSDKEDWNLEFNPL